MARKPAKPPHVYIISRARQVWRWSPEHQAAIEAARVGPDLVKCAKCDVRMPRNMKRRQRKLFAVDHIVPIVGANERSPKLPNEPGCLSWDVWLERLHFGKLQILCHPCHNAKSAKEGKARTNARKKKKS